MIVKDSQHALDPELDTDVSRGKVDVKSGKMCWRNAAVQSLAAERKYLAVRGNIHFLRIFVHVTTAKIDIANLSQMYIPTSLLTIRVGEDSSSDDEYHDLMGNEELDISD